jgi:predicted nucleotidyltransferase
MHEVRKFFHLLRKGNPNVHALLWLKPEHYLKKTAAGQLILTHKTNFFSKHIYNAFIGYSRSEMSKIEKMVYGKAGQRGRSLIRKHGYNTINASHTIRLLRMLNEFLETREFFTYREPDADELIAIKTGKVDKDTVINEALKLLSKAESLFKEISWLPENTDRETLSRLCVDVAKTAYQERGSEW